MVDPLTFSPGSPGVIEFRERAKKKFTTFFRGYKHKSYLIIDQPVENGRLVPVGDGSVCVVRFINEGNILGFLTKVLAVVRNPAPLLFLVYPDHVEKTKLRKHDRYPVTLEAFISDKKIESESEGGFKSTILNVSAGGCLLNTVGAYDKGNFIFVSVKLPEIGWVYNVEAEVMRSDIADNDCTLGLAFVDFLDPNYEQVVGFIHHLEAYQVRS